MSLVEGQPKDMEPSSPKAPNQTPEVKPEKGLVQSIAIKLQGTPGRVMKRVEEWRPPEFTQTDRECNI